MNKYILKEVSSYWYVKSLNPFTLTSGEREALTFTYEEAQRVIYLYGLGEKYDILQKIEM